MKFTNQQNIDVISSFIMCYADLLNEVMNVEINIVFLPLLDNPQNDPLMCYANRIEYSEEICGKLGLSEAEVHAMVAHEIGHLLDKENSETIPREICADSMAKVLGLGEALINGLRKLIKSGLYPEQEDMINERIKILETEDNRKQSPSKEEE